MEFKTVGLLGKKHRDQGNAPIFLRLIEYLKSQQCQVLLAEDTTNILQQTQLPMMSRSDLAAQSDLLIVVGGDGSLLNAAADAICTNTPVLGINRGQLGFLTDIAPHAIERIGLILQGQYRVEERFLLKATVKTGEEITYQDIALNDVVLQCGSQAQMIRFSIFINDTFVIEQRADGLIVSTPTGSTAYALSGGGPIVHPALDAMLLVPMFPHTLSSRPIVVSGDSLIKIHLYPDNQVSPQVSSDGRSPTLMLGESELHIQKHESRLRLVHPLDYHYYETLRSKLGWR